jgi:hypothetical protein
MSKQIFISAITLFVILTLQTHSQTSPTTNEIRKQSLENQMANPTWQFSSIVDTFELFRANEPESEEEEPEDFEEQFRKWEEFWGARAMYPESPSGGDILGAQQWLKTNSTGRCTNGMSGYSWVSEGPDRNSNNLANIGLTCAMCMDPNNSSILYTGTNHAGIFKSTDGGTTWSNITDVLNIIDLCTSSIDVSASNSQRVLAGFGPTGFWPNPGMAQESTNGGASWQNLTFGSQSPATSAVSCTRYHPAGTSSYVSFRNELFRRNDLLTAQPFVPVSFSPSNLLSTDHDIYDIEFYPGNSNVMYAATTRANATTANTSKIIISTNGGQTFQDMGFPSGAFPGDRVAIDVSPSNPTKLYAFYIDSPPSGTVKYVIAEATLAFNGTWSWTWNILKSTTKTTVDSGVALWFGWSNFFAVSDQYPGKFLIGNGRILRGDWNSSNTNIYTVVTDYYPTLWIGSNTHADIRYIRRFNHGSTETILAGTDGGVAKSTDGGATWSSINGIGLNVSQFYCISSFQKTSNLIASPQDNFVQRKVGSFWYNVGAWSTGAESSCCLVDYTNDDHIFYGATKRIWQSYDQGATYTDITSGVTNAPTNNWLRKFYDDPTKPGVIWAGCSGNPNTYSYNPTTNAWSIARTPTGWQGCPVPDMDVLKVAPTNSNCIYEGHGGWNIIDPNNPNPCATTPTYNRLFKKGIFMGTLQWRDFTPYVIQYLGDLFLTTGITAIVIDPLNENRVFVSFDQFKTNARVIRSLDGGFTWADMSAGLPPVTVNDLVYQNGTDDVIYAATDFGVYRYNKTAGQWECFNTNLPPVIVKKIEINYCSRKLFIATQGRGAFSCNLPTTPTYPITVARVQAANGNSSSVLTLQPYYNQAFANDISIEAGVILNQKGIMRFSSNSSLIIKKNARVNLTGTLTTLCTQMWPGVQVEGSTNQVATFNGQLSNNQGILDINTQGTIMHADIGVITCTYSGGQDVWGSHGGIIYAVNANFIDNKKDVSFLYHDKPNSSKFVNCNFETKDYLPNNVAPEGHVSLHAVSNINFQGCDFKYTAQNKYPAQSRGYGIYSLDAKYMVTPGCLSNVSPCTNLDRTTFQNLTLGIYSYATNALNNVYVSDAEFTNVIKNNAYFLSIDNITFKNNKIILPSTTLGSRAGLYLDKCKKYTVSTNTVLGTGTNQDYGITARSSNLATQVNGSNHLIYKNTIDNCITAVASMYENADANYVGLKIRCNRFGATTPNSWDVTQLLGTTARVDRYQGTSPGSSGNLANLVGNYYTSVCYSSSENRWYIDNQVPVNQNTKVIHCNNSGSNYQVNPPCSNQPLDYYTYGSYNSSTQCLALTTGENPGGIAGRIGAAESAVSGALANEASIIDAGNTSNLLNIIAAGTPEDVKNSLLDVSPYLSDDVLTAYFSNPATPPAHVVEVHAQNNPVTENVWQIILNRGFHGSEQDQLEANQNAAQVSGRQTLEVERHNAEFERALAYTDKLNYFLSDTLPSSVDSVLATLQHVPFTDGNCQAISHKIASGIEVTADQINSAHGGASQVDDYCNFQKIKCQLPDTARDWRSLLHNSSLLASVQSIANDPNNAANGAATAALEFIFNTFSEKEFQLPPSSRQLAEQTIVPELKEIYNADLDVLIYPNPTDGELNIECPSPEGVKIEFANSTGEKVMEIQMLEKKTKANIGKLPAGIYMLTLRNANKTVGSYKIVLTK